jgi:hypothetical protein
MGVPVKVSDELVEAAREVAGQANRSMTKQIEHWAELGRAVEHLAPMPDLTALKAGRDPGKTAEARAALRRLAIALADTEDRAAALRVIRSTAKPTFGAVPGRDDRVRQVWPDGREVIGRIIDQEFVADEPGPEPSV